MITLKITTDTKLTYAGFPGINIQGNDFLINCLVRTKQRKRVNISYTFSMTFFR